MDLQRFLIGLGLVILIIGIMWPILSRAGLGRINARLRLVPHNLAFLAKLIGGGAKIALQDLCDPRE